jgi:Zn-dependent protease with chaperone function
MGKLSLGAELIEVQLVQELYDELRQQLVRMQMLPGNVVASQEVIVYYSAKHEFMILPNGSLYLSESMLEEVLSAGGLPGLAFVLLHELAHQVKSHLRQNLISSNKFGDLKR